MSVRNISTVILYSPDHNNNYYYLPGPFCRDKPSLLRHVLQESSYCTTRIIIHVIMHEIETWAPDQPRMRCAQEILSLGNFVARQNFLGKSVAATIFPRKFCRSILTQRPHFLGNSVALLHRDTLPRSTAEFDIGGGTRGHWGPVPPLMSREEAASYIGNAVAALK